MRRLEDAARFRNEDADELVAAAFACPVCLRRPLRVLLTPAADDEAVGHCLCVRCDAQWDVRLDAGQHLRMTLAPPHGLWLRTGRRGPGAEPT